MTEVEGWSKGSRRSTGRIALESLSFHPSQNLRIFWPGSHTSHFHHCLVHRFHCLSHHHLHKHYHLSDRYTADPCLTASSWKVRPLLQEYLPVASVHKPFLSIRAVSSCCLQKWMRRLHSQPHQHTSTRFSSSWHRNYHLWWTVSSP